MSHGNPPLTWPDQYSVEMVRSDGETKVTYRDRELTRVEHWRQGVLSNFVIGRPDRETIYMCWPSEKQFTETKLQPEEEEAMAWNPDQEELWRQIGSEVVEGIPCDVYERWRTAFSRVCGKVWVDVERQVRVREINVNRVGELVLQCDFRNVQIGPPDPSLFEVPSGYTRFEVPSSS